MDNKHEMDENDPLKEYYREIARGMNPPPKLVNKVKGGVTVKLFPKSVHVKRFVQAAACYVIGVALLLSAVILLPKLWERGEPIVTQPPQIEGTTTALIGESPEPTSEIVLSTVFEGKTVKEFQLWNWFYYSYYSISDEDAVHALASELADTTVVPDSHYDYFQEEIIIKIMYADGTSGRFEFELGSNALNYREYDSEGKYLGMSGLKLYRISDGERERLEICVNTQIEAVIRKAGIRLPDEYLGGELSGGRSRLLGSEMRSYLDSKQAGAVAEQLRTILGNLPLVETPLEFDKNGCQWELVFEDGEQVCVSIGTDTGLICVRIGEDLDTENVHHVYNYRVSKEKAEEYVLQLRKLSHFAFVSGDE